MHPAARWFRIAAVAETLSWAGLLAGMFFKYVVVHNDLGVFVFGRLHGAMFVFYLGTLLWVARAGGWSRWRLLLGAAASVPPLVGLLFERWIARRSGPDGLIEVAHWIEAVPAAPTVAAGQTRR